MEIKRTISRIFWHIDAKPEGGSIARSNDATVPPLEAATRAELEDKIKIKEEKMVAEMNGLFPGLKLDLAKPGSTLISLEAHADSGVIMQPGDASRQSAEAGTKKGLDNWLTQNALTLLAKQLPPDVAEQLKEQAHDGKLKIVVGEPTKLNLQTQVRTNVITYETGKTPFGLSSPEQKTPGALQPSAPVPASFSTSQLDTGSPITPVSGGNSFILFLLAAIVLLGLLLLFIHIKK